MADLQDSTSPKARGSQVANSYAENKASHDTRISPMSPNYCLKCDKSGSELGMYRCPYADTSVTDLPSEGVNANPDAVNAPSQEGIGKKQ